MSRENRKVPKNLLVTGIGEILGTILGFYATILTARYLGVSGFGRFTLYIGVLFAAWFIMEAGLMNILVRELSRRLKDPDEYNLHLGAFRCLVSCLCGVILAMAGLLVVLVPPLWKLRYMVLLLGVCITAMFQALTLASVVRAHEDMEYFSIGYVLRTVFLVGAILGISRLDAGFLAVFIAWTGSYIFFWAFLWVVVRRRYGLPRLVADVARWKYVIKESLPLGLGQIFRRLANLVDIFVLRALSTVTNVGIFFCAYRFIMVLSGTAGTLGIPFLPVFSRLAANRDERLDAGLEKGLLFLIAAAVPMTFLLFIYGTNIITLFFGHGFALGGGDLSLLGFTLVLVFPGTLFVHVFTALGKQRLWAFCTGACLGINALMDYLLVPHLGHRGAVWGTMSAEVVQFGIGLYLIHSLGFRMPIHRLLTRPLLAGISVGGLLYEFSGVSPAGMLTHAAFALMLYCLLLWVLRVFTMKDFAAFIPKRALEGD